MADLDWVTERLAIGGKVDSLYDAREIAGLGVTHVLSLRAGDKHPEHVDDERGFWKSIGGVKFANAPTHDDGEPKPVSWFKQGIVFAHGALLDAPSSKVLIHCKDGDHRSPVMAYAVLRAWGTNGKDAEEHVNDARKGVDLDKYAADAERALKALGYT